MSQLDDHISRVEKYGYVRWHFPMDYNGHRISILQNDAHRTNDGRLLFDFTLHCSYCGVEDGLSGRFPADFEDQIAGVVNAKIAAFDEFQKTACRNV